MDMYGTVNTPRHPGPPAEKLLGRYLDVQGSKVHLHLVDFRGNRKIYHTDTHPMGEKLSLVQKLADLKSDSPLNIYFQKPSIDFS